MAAGQGFKTFVTGEVLTAGDVNGYLMQGINVFASTAARDAAITAPAEGQFAFTKDTNGLWYYDGAAWVASGATGDIEGVTAGIGISGGGTSGTVTITNSMATAIDAKGDLVAGTGADTFSRLAVGTNGTVLKANSATATGLEWGSAAAADNFTLLNSGATSLSGSTTKTVSSISGVNTLMIYIYGASAAANDYFKIRINGATTDYLFAGTYYSPPSTYNAVQWNSTGDSAADGWLLSKSSSSATSVCFGGIMIMGANSSGLKTAIWTAGNNTATGTEPESRTHFGYRVDSNAITSVSIVSSGGNFDAGSWYVYGA